MTPSRSFPFRSSLMLVLAAQVAVAQQSSAIHGTVKGSDGRPVQGVRVLLDSPAIFAQRTTLTDAKGEWHAPLLPVGTYKVEAVKDGFSAAARSGVRVGLGSDVRVDLVLAPVQGAVVEVTAERGSVIDKTEVNSGANFSAELQYELPLVDRSFYGALDMTPGTDISTDGSNYVIRGGSTTYTNYRVNGAEVKDDYANGLGATWVIDDNIEDTQVVTSQVNVRFGRALGGSVNVVTKSGGNEFEGSLRVKLSRDDWKARTPDTLPGTVWGDTLNPEYDITVRGPVIKDRLWFSFGTILKPNQSWGYTLGQFPAEANAPAQTGDAAVDALLNAGPAGYHLTTFDNGAGYIEKFDSSYYEGKLTGAINPNHTLEVSFVSQKQNYSNADPSGSAISLAALCSNYQKYEMRSLNYKGILGAASFLEGRLTTSKTIWGQQTGDPASGGREGVYLQYGQAGAPENGIQAAGLPFGFPLGASPEDHGNISGDLNLKLLREWHGSHDLDLGVEYFDSYTDNGEDWGSRSLMFFAGGAYQSDSGAGLLFPVVNYTPGQNYMSFDAAAHWAYGAGPVVRQALGTKGRASCTQVGFYGNDTWTVDSHLMFGAGLRVDTNKAIDVGGRNLAKSSDPTYSFLARWDPRGDSAHLVTFTASSSAGNFNQALFGQFTAKKTTVEIDRGWNANAVDIGAGPAAQAVQFVPYSSLVDLANYGKVIAFIDQSKHNVLASDLRPPRTEELTLGYKRSYPDQSRVGITLVFRRWTDLWAQRYDYAPQYVIDIADPSGSGLPSMQDVTPRWENNNTLTRQYRAVEVEFAKHFSPRWSLQGSYTYSRLTGNCEDGDYGAWGGWRLNDSVPGTQFWNPMVLNKMGLTTNDYGPSGTLNNNQTHKARLALLHVLPVGRDGRMTLALLARYDSGKSWSARSYAPIDPSKYPAAMATDYPNLGVTPDLTYYQYYAPYGAYTDNDTFTFDFKATWDVPLRLWKVHFIGDARIANLFNVTMPMNTYHRFVNDSSNGSSQLLLRNPSYWGSTAVDGYQPFFIPGRAATFSCGFRF